MRASSDCWISRSVVVSVQGSSQSTEPVRRKRCRSEPNALVASSRSRIGGDLSMVRARETRCFCAIDQIADISLLITEEVTKLLPLHPIAGLLSLPHEYHTHRGTRPPSNAVEQPLPPLRSQHPSNRSFRSRCYSERSAKQREGNSICQTRR